MLFAWVLCLMLQVDWFDGNLFACSSIEDWLILRLFV